MDDILASIRRIIADDHRLDSRGPDWTDAGSLHAAPAEPDEAPAPAIEDPAEPEAELELRAALRTEPPSDVEAAPEPPASRFRVPPPPDLRMNPARFAARPSVRPIVPTHAAPPASAPELGETAVPPLPLAAEVPSAPPAPAARTAGPETLLSHAATASVGEAFNALSHTILSANNARTLEDIVQDMLRPMLQVWLDDNLPPLVERLVRAEIERVARGRS